MAEIITTSVTCAGGLPAFIAAPAGPAKVPVIVILHERYGLVQHTKDLAMRHAREGLVCIAADYFFRHPDQDALHRGDVGYDMTDPESLDYMTAALDECAAAIDAIDPGLLERGYADVWLPHPDQVAAGQLVGYCIVEDDAPRTGSLLGATP